MPTGPSGVFTRLLQGTGVITAARRLEQYGNNFSAINALMGEFRGLQRSEAGSLVSLGAAARRSGRYLESLPPGDVGNISGIPINAALFGTQPGGRRYQYNVEVNVVDRETGEVLTRLSYVFEEGRLQDPEFLKLQAIQAAHGAISRYADLQERIGEDETYDLQAVLTTGQRRY